MPIEGLRPEFLFGAVLFTPGDRPERFEKGLKASRGALILDLEDGVAPERKSEARDAVAAWIASGNHPLVRVNAVRSQAFRDDVARLFDVSISAILIPKAESATDVEAVRSIWPSASLYPLIESPLGLAQVAEIARHAGVRQLCFGALDLHAACGMRFPQQSFLDYCRIQLVVASKVARIAPPVDTPYPGYQDSAAVTQDAAAAARLGFNAKLCIHPAQLEPVNAAFRPSAEDTQWAREVVEASRKGGAVTVGGAMVDAPVVASAQQILARSAQLERDSTL